jgi:hypothetical protein
VVNTGDWKEMVENLEELRWKKWVDISVVEIFSRYLRAVRDLNVWIMPTRKAKLQSVNRCDFVEKMDEVINELVGIAPSYSIAFVQTVNENHCFSHTMYWV